MRYGLTLGGTRRRASNAQLRSKSRPELRRYTLAIVFNSFLTELRDEPAFDGHRSSSCSKLRQRPDIAQSLHFKVRHHADPIGDRFAESAQGLERRLAFFKIAAVAHREINDRLRNTGCVRQQTAITNVDSDVNSSGTLIIIVVEKSQGLHGYPRLGTSRCHPVSARAMEPIFKRGYDSEIPATSPDGPEQIRVFLHAHSEHPAASPYQLGGHKVVASSAKFTIRRPSPPPTV